MIGGSVASDRSAAQDRCECGADPGDIHFDRSICACGSMHYFCNQCGTQAEPCSDESPAATKRGWERVEELREKAARRGRINHAEGARYATADWDDVLFLIAEIDELRAALNHKEEA
jgi:hypothetical protein